MKTSMRRSAVAAAAASVVGILFTACGGNGSAPTAPAVEVLSSRPEFVTGGDALVRVRPAESAVGLTTTMLLNGSDVSSAFRADPSVPGTMLGMLSGLKEGDNTFSVTTQGSAETRLSLTNYPKSGPVLSGPQLQPYVCMTDNAFMPDGSTLGAPTDAKCSAPSKVRYVYKTTAGVFKPLPSLTALPGDVASATVNGAAVPYVVRFEAGTIDRGIYNIAVLHDPTKEAEPSPVAPPKGWNKRLSYVHGYGCVGGWYYQGTHTGASVNDLYDISRYLSEGIVTIKPRPENLAASFNVLADSWLSKGYAVATNTLNHPSISCNPHLAGEATMMTKEYFIEKFGVPQFTVSSGGSGGAYTSLQIADAYPGLFDGVSISATFPDALSLGLAGLHAHLMFHYWSDLAPGTLNDAQKIAITGYAGVQAALDAANQSARTDPTSGRKISWSTAYTSGQWTVLGGAYPALEAVPASLRWDAATNPKGARPSVFDVGRNVYGVDAATGYALRPFDNVGIQYGLNALNSGAITLDQFIDLNQKVGGVDSNGNFIASRTTADAGAIKRVYQSGVNLGGNGGLASIPIFDNGASTETGGYHYGWYHYAVRERLRAANGNSDNFVMWRGVFPAQTGMDLFEQWMAAYKADTSADSQRAKVLRAKPANAVEGCWDKATPARFIREDLVFSSKPDTQCSTLWPVYSNTFKEAGGPLAANVLKCQLKAVDAADYKVPVSADQLNRLKTVFAGGVCDWSKPGVNQSGVLPYASFGPSPVNQVFDITKP